MTQLAPMAVLSLCAVFAGCTVQSPNTPKAAVVQSPDVGVTILYDQSAAAYYVNVENHAAMFLCLPLDEFDTRRGGIVLTDTRGNRVSQRAFADAAPDLDLGFDFARSILIVRPRSAHRIYIDVSNFKIVSGRYRYTILASVFSCRDVVDESRIAARRDVQGFAVSGDGMLNIEALSKN